MRLFHLTRYKLFSRHIKSGRQLRIFVASDLHFSYQVKDDKLSALVNFARQNSPDYILIPGDLIDSNDMISDPNEEKRLLTFLKNLGTVAPVIIGLGNHDFYKKPKTTAKPKMSLTSRICVKLKLRHFWDTVINTDFRKKVCKIPNIHLLDNSAYEDSRIYIFGFTQSPAYYNYFKNNNNTFKPSRESCDEMLRELDHIDQSYLAKLPKNKPKLVMVHSPSCLHDYRVQAEFSRYDYFVSGHMHNGLVPPVLDEIIPGNHGLVGPGMNLFPGHIRHTIKKATDKSIVVGAVTSLHQCSGILHHGNAFFPSYTALIELSSNKKYSRKPDVSRKYYNWQ